MDLNLPNLLTLFRILAAPLICLSLLIDTPAGPWPAFGLYVLACVSDYLDGWLARTRGQQTTLGKVLDPLADKVLVASILVTLAGVGRLDGLSIMAAVLILCREFLVSGARELLAETRTSLPVTRLAKWKTGVQMVALGLLIAGSAGPLLSPLPLAAVGAVALWIAALLTVVTGYEYLAMAVRHVRRQDAGGGSRGRVRTDPARGGGR